MATDLQVYIAVCDCVYMCVCICYVYICIHTCACIYVCACIHSYMYVFMHALLETSRKTKDSMY